MARARVSSRNGSAVLVHEAPDSASGSSMCVCHLLSEEAWLHCRACLGFLPGDVRSVCSCVQVGQLELVYHAHMLLSPRPSAAAARDNPERKRGSMCHEGGKNNKSRFQVMVISFSGSTNMVTTTSSALVGDCIKTLHAS